MTHYRMLDRHPSAMITNNRNELKVYQGNNVYLNNGDNFELRFFNPLQEKIGVEIIFNGIKKGDGFLVLNPGQDLILDRFLDEQRKMIFETYTINENDAAAVKAIEKNGVITFNFYKEYHNYYYNCNDDINININYNFPPKSKTKSKHGNYVSRGIKGAQGPCGAAGAAGAAGTGSGFSTTWDSVYFPSTTNTVTFSSVSSSNSTLTSSFEDSFTSNNFKNLETGRVEKGEYSNQSLKQVNAQFNSKSFYSMTYHILPYSTMNRNNKEVREYCTCGYRIRKQTWEFCPKCGSKLC